MNVVIIRSTMDRITINGNKCMYPIGQRGAIENSAIIFQTGGDVEFSKLCACVILFMFYCQ